MKHFLPILLFLLVGLNASAQANRWFGMDKADSTKWGWNLVSGMKDGFCMPGDTFCLHPLEFVFVPTDTADISQEGYQITFGGYWMGVTEITQAIWILVMGSPLPHWEVRCDSLPATVTDVQQALSFVKKFNDSRGMGANLPTREQWLFASRGGHYSEGYLYPGSNRLDYIAWLKKNSKGRLHPVAQRVPNEIGLYDMYGNAAEIVIGDYGTYEIVGYDYHDDPLSHRQDSSSQAKAVGFRICYPQLMPFYDTSR